MAITQKNRKQNNMSLVLVRLNEKERRWVAALLAEYIGHGGTKLVWEETGIDRKTIRQGGIDIKNKLENCSPNKIRLKGAGRPFVKKFRY